MSIAADYLEIIEKVANAIRLPVIREIHVASASSQSGKSSKFGAMILENDIVGLTFVDLDAARHDLQPILESKTYIGCSPAEVAVLYAGDQGWQRALGMAAINAISQCVLTGSGCLLPDTDNTMGLLQPEQDDHIGMVGYFPPLVEMIREKNIALTVIELDQKWVQSEQDFEVTIDSSKLNVCNKLLCTGTVLINHTLDRILEQAKNADELYLVGPTLGCLPDPLFDRGVTAVGGRQVVNCAQFVDMWRAGESWRAASKRYRITAESYPGYRALIS
jgi:uncharacterized protein (DUF4213/DUF364 family)